jgi:hypothetical protein
MSDMDPRALGAIDMLRRTGALSVQVRFSDDEEPTLWMACGEWAWLDGRPVPATTPGAMRRYEAAGALTVERALLRLCEQVIDGGMCAHCNRPTIFDDGFDETLHAEVFCWTQWDPELRTFRRDCEGS